MAKIIQALRALNVEVKLIPDIDVLNDKDVFKGIVEAFGVEWEAMEKDYNIIVSNLKSPKERIETATARRGIESVFESAADKFLSNSQIEAIRKEIATISKWKALKDAGCTAIPRGDATAAFGRLNQACKGNGIFIVTVGELECFVKEVGGHGPDWVNTVLERYPNLDHEVYSGVKNFISGIGL